MPHAPSIWLRPLRRLGRRLTRALRVLMVVLVVLGLTPLVELVEHLVAEPAPAAEAEAGCVEDCSKGCDDAGCHGDMHHCSCCGTGARALNELTRWDLRLTQGRTRGGSRDRAPPGAIDSPPLPPPRS